MTAEQYQQVISIDNRINQLEKVQEQIKETKTHYLTYRKKETDSSLGDSICADYIIRYISDILDKHDIQIRKEINAEILKLKESIKDI